MRELSVSVICLNNDHIYILIILIDQLICVIIFLLFTILASFVIYSKLKCLIRFFIFLAFRLYHLTKVWQPQQTLNIILLYFWVVIYLSKISLENVVVPAVSYVFASSQGPHYHRTNQKTKLTPLHPSTYQFVSQRYQQCSIFQYLCLISRPLKTYAKIIYFPNYYYLWYYYFIVFFTSATSASFMLMECF